MYRTRKEEITIEVNSLFAFAFDALLIGALAIQSYAIRHSSREIASLQDQIADNHALTLTMHDIMNPAPAEFPDEPDVDTHDPHTYTPDIQHTDSHEQNNELNDRVAMLKEQIARVKGNIGAIKSPTPMITPLHPDVYNIPHEELQLHEFAPEYVK